MKICRLFALTLLFVCVTLFSTALATETVALDDIGIRYTPTADEIYVTRDQMTDAALNAFGTDRETLLASMQRDNLYLISLQPDGRQFSLGIGAVPDGLTSGEYSGLTAADKDSFLTQLARRGNYGSAVWQTDGYALFSSSMETPDAQSLSYASLSLSTLYLNRVYTFRTELIGREVAQADQDLLLSAAGRTLRLGACAQTDATDAVQATPLSLPDTTVSGNTIAFSYQDQGCALSLDPLPDTIGLTWFTLSGTTVPDGYLRYAVNGQSSSRIKADAQGAFSLTVPNLTGNAENQIDVTAFKGDLKNTVSFTVQVEWQSTPLALQTSGAVAADTVTLQGLALPGSSVKLTKGRGSKNIEVAEDGSFSVTLALPKVGANIFNLQVQSTGYRRYDYSFTVTRRETDADAMARLQKLVKSVTYAKLNAKPSAYADQVVQLSGKADTPRYGNGSPSFILTDESGNRYTVRCADLLKVTQDASVTLLGTLTGAVSAEDGLPEVALEVLL